MSTIQFTIDQGNTRTKLAIFEDRNLLEQCTFGDKDQEERVLEKIKSSKASKGIFSSVRDNQSDFIIRLNENFVVLIESPELDMPFQMNYETPETLGSDRKANAAAFMAEFGLKNGLIVDCGTCITYSLLLEGALSGGAISPGIAMRYRSLGDYTGRLPTLPPLFELPPYLGKSTSGSLRSGVELAIVGEVEKMIEQYCSHINDLIVIITGGDMSFFERHLKSPIFARPLYTLTGLNEIFLCNTK
ncbi:MAG: type III pantothenate kinase [Flavobacteriales bacterium]